jgi:hypothetical protein
MGICLYCGLEVKRNLMYCNKKCATQQYLKIARLKKIKIREIENLKCRICDTIIMNTRRHYFCSSKCQKIFTTENRKRKPILERRICIICKNEYDVVNPNQKNNCLNLECKKQNQQNIRRNKYKNLTQEQKVYYRTVDPKKHKDIKSQTIKCKCPNCEKFHFHTFTPAWIGNGIPKIYCSNCRFLKVPETYENIGGYNRCRM